MRKGNGRRKDKSDSQGTERTVGKKKGRRIIEGRKKGKEEEGKEGVKEKKGRKKEDKKVEGIEFLKEWNKLSFHFRIPNVLTNLATQFYHPPPPAPPYPRLG